MELICTRYDEDSFRLELVSMGYIEVNFNYIASLWIEPENRRKGYGTLLLASAETIILGNRYDECILDAIPKEISREVLDIFYTKNGYVNEHGYRYKK
jgi:GNAT superfamily N-acetyltransferase